MDVDSESYGDEDGAYRYPTLRIGARDTGGRDSDIGGQVINGEGRTHTRGHLARDVGVHGPVDREQSSVDAEQAVLERRVVGDDSAAHDGRGAGGLDELGDEHPTRERFGDGDGESALDESGDDLGATQGGRP